MQPVAESVIKGRIGVGRGVLDATRPREGGRGGAAILRIRKGIGETPATLKVRERISANAGIS
jgi:hypothetical protein